MHLDESAQTEDNKSHISPPVFFGSAALIIGFVLFGATYPDFLGDLFGSVQNWIVTTFGWFYMLAVALFLIFSIGVAFSSLGQIKLGPDDSEPDYSYSTWFAMLFSAGMGIGLMFYGVAEPIMHWQSPPSGQSGTIEAAREAMRITFFHWGVHAWSIYAVIGMALAYFGFRHDLPLTIRSALYPLIGDRIQGIPGHLVDILAVLGTMFGVATSLGLGVLQVNSGLNYLFDVPEGITTQLILIAVITAMATASVVSGLDVGIRRLSELNLILAILLIVFVLVAGPTLHLLNAFTQNLGQYITNIVDKTFNLYAYKPNDWMGGWTLFYWAWWIAWSPFVGMFIARVSRGRTIREFVVGVLFAPVGFTFIWMTVFGNSAIHLDLGVASGAVAAAVGDNVSTALFKFLEFFPFSGVASLLATVLVITFFVTSSDSGSLVIDIITSGGRTDPPVWQRIFWAVTEGVVAAVLLLTGGLGALQTASITAALPFTIVMVLVCWGLLKGLRKDGVRRQLLDLPAGTQVRGAAVAWEQRLKTILSYPTRDKARKFLEEVGLPALEDVAREIGKTNLEATIEKEEGAISLTVWHGEEQDFQYAVKLRGYARPSFALSDFGGKNAKESRRYYRAEVHLLEGGQNYDVFGSTKESLLADVLSQYERHMQYLHLYATAEASS
ncbi:BCCT family transporter [Photobacterium ganghwense]|uniref:BCCT family transporter n=1 Tax=Photobacterium ganghwense TaxID=320778 RepID=UPI0039F01A5A